MIDENHEIFKKLVTHESDIIGIIAYSIFQKEKSEHIEVYKSCTNNKNMLLTFLESKKLDVNINKYREQASLQFKIDFFSESFSKCS